MWIFFVFLWIVVPDCQAANPYKLGEVDYFHREKPSDQQPLNWTEPLISSDGEVALHVPPEPVLTLLNNPTPENARIYLEWQQRKVERILQAQKAIDNVLKNNKLL